MSDEKNFEWRVGWSAFTMAAFRGRSDWRPFGGFADTVEEVQEQLEENRGVSDALEAVIDACGFEWFLEVREVGDE